MSVQSIVEEHYLSVSLGIFIVLVGISAVDYIYNLRGLKYPSDEYTETRSKVSLPNITH